MLYFKNILNQYLWFCGTFWLERPNASSCSKFLAMPACHLVHQTVHCSRFTHVDGTEMNVSSGSTWHTRIFICSSTLVPSWCITQSFLWLTGFTLCRATAVVPVYPLLSPWSSLKLFSVYSWKILWPLGWDWNEGFLMDFQSRSVGFLPSWGFVRKPLGRMENLWSKHFGWRW